ncbi:MAG TPA: hypothetical protein VHT95_12315 [Vicinamibacterales bacterium]|nr:hypothetical protein [Vicinamibacterales bacterium]
MRQERKCGQARLLGRLGLALTFLIGAAACGSSPSTPTTTPTVPRTTDTFNGTVAVGGRDFHSFTITTTGTVDVTLTAAAPPATIVMGVSVGIPANGLCPAMSGASTLTAAGGSVQLSGILSPGLLCVDVHDVGNQSAPVSYTVTVTHP